MLELRAGMPGRTRDPLVFPVVCDYLAVCLEWYIWGEAEDLCRPRKRAGREDGVCGWEEEEAGRSGRRGLKKGHVYSAVAAQRPAFAHDSRPARARMGCPAEPHHNAGSRACPCNVIFEIHEADPRRSKLQHATCMFEVLSCRISTPMTALMSQHLAARA